MLTVPDVHNGGFRSAVLVDEGTFEGPRLRGRAIPNSGGDYAHFRADDTAVFDARYLLEIDDGTMIYMQNRGFLWGRTPDAMTRLRAWAFEGGPPVPHEDYYLRAQPTFETPQGQARLADPARLRRHRRAQARRQCRALLRSHLTACAVRRALSRSRVPAFWWSPGRD